MMSAPTAEDSSAGLKLLAPFEALARRRIDLPYQAVRGSARHADDKAAMAPWWPWPLRGPLASQGSTHPPARQTAMMSVATWCRSAVTSLSPSPESGFVLTGAATAAS